MISNDKIIIHNFTLDIIKHSLDVLCQIPAVGAMGTFAYYKIITFSEERYLPTSNWSDTELKNAISSYTQVPAENVFFISELSDEERTFLNTFPKQFMR